MRLHSAQVVAAFVVLGICIGACTTGAEKPAVSLTDKTWTLTAIGTRSLEPVAGKKSPNLQLSKDGNVSGFAGCNRLMGRYAASGTSLDFTGIGSTKMYCDQGMDVEQQLLDILSRVSTYRIEASRLELLGTADSVLARFEVQTTE